MKIEVNRHLNLYGKSNGYIASFGEWQEQGKTKEEAKENLINAIEWFMQDTDFMPIFKDANSRIIMLNRNFYGYTITAIEKESSVTALNTFGRISAGEAKNYLKSYVENYMNV